MDYLEVFLEGQSWVAGPKLTVADFAIAATVATAEVGKLPLTNETVEFVIGCFKCAETLRHCRDASYILNLQSCKSTGLFMIVLFRLCCTILRSIQTSSYGTKEPRKSWNLTITSKLLNLEQT